MPDSSTNPPAPSAIDTTLRQLRRLLVILSGSLVILVGIAMIVLPGPAFVVIPAGLGILALEFFWARRLLVRVRRGVRRMARSVRPSDDSGAPSGASESDQPTIQGGRSKAIV